MKIHDFIFAGKNYTHINMQSELLHIVSKLPICAFHSNYNVGESLKVKAKISAWWTYQGVAVSVKAFFKDREELQNFMSHLDWSDNLKPEQAKNVFEEMLKISVDTHLLTE